MASGFISTRMSEMNPPHIHITGRGGEMKVWLKTLAVASSYALKPTDQRKLVTVVRENQNFFMEKWNEFARKKN